MFVYCENPIRMKNPNPLLALQEPLIEVPCGQCILCRLRTRKEWTLRLRLEASLYEDNCFVTLTYDEEHVPPEVQVRDVQLFVKRLRKNSKLKFRFYSVSEYGDQTQRPHFHLILFGFPLSQAVKYVPKSWDLGLIKVSPLSDRRCSYACGYTAKKYDKRTDKSLYSLFPYMSYHERLALYLNCSDLLKKKYHKNIDPRRAEFVTCSLGIGLGYLLKNWKKITEDFCIHFGGKKYSVPRYFRKKIEEIQAGWIFDFKKHMEDFARERLLGLFDKASNTYQDNDMYYDYDWYLEDLWRDYVQHKADTTKRLRELTKGVKEL